MLAEERQKLILEHIRLYGRVRAVDMARELNVAEVTIRRDLNGLHSAGMLSRIHGGAVRRGQEQPGSPGQKLVGIVVPSSLYYFSEVIRGAESAAERFGVRLVLGVSDYGAVEQDRVRRMIALGVEGILLATAAGDSDPGAATWLEDISVPTVLMERAFGSPGLKREMDHVRTDHRAGAVLALRHLHGLGHRSIAVAMSETPTSYWLELGCRDAWEILGLTNQPDVVQLGRVGGDGVPAELERLLDRCLADRTRAFFVHNDMAAALLVELAFQRGLRIPEDIAVVAYDDVTASMAPVPLTAVSPPKQAVGSLALEQLMRSIGYGSTAAGPVSHLSLLPTLHIRESCGAREPRADR
ncbi:substrate-binding domain-containing protein [Pseudarthrobacter sp. SSS035]|uniref:substrate-binding domain-containing protein n=1 Tax=Pseudarthrobacter sp. SSS035 TaxID=2931399 RepID=UPI00200D1ED5|nr:substrate-binding domain-containing protein [Pseudarthrobacter sp. SSS035]